ncbi:MAG: hypothetical protein WKG01_39605 [Kofleriaceae bacterium]
MSRSFLLLLAACVPAVAACKSDATEPKREKASEPAQKLAGVYPDKFECTSIATPDTLAEILGGPVAAKDNVLPIPPGVPQPCNYRVDKGTIQTDAGPLQQEES